MPFVEKEEKNGIIIVGPKNKIFFLIDEKNNKEVIQLQLTRLNGNLDKCEENKIENFTTMSSKKQKYMHQKRMRSKEMIQFL